MYAALDIGGSHIRIALSNTLENIDFSNVNITRPSGNYIQDLGYIREKILELANGQNVEKIGISFAGAISEDKKSIGIAPNLPDWNNRSISNDLSNIFNAKTFLENDATCAGLGEAFYGEGIEKNFVFLVWGTGIGGTDIRIINGKQIAFPFEPGHQIIKDGGNLCGCGQHGCAESYIGGKNIQKYFKKNISELNENEWEQIEEHLVQTIINITALRNTKKIIFGGGISLNYKQRLDNSKEILMEKLKIFPLPEISITSLGDFAGLYGAFSLIKD